MSSAGAPRAWDLLLLVVHRSLFVQTLRYLYPQQNSLYPQRLISFRPPEKHSMPMTKGQAIGSQGAMFAAPFDFIVGLRVMLATI